MIFKVVCISESIYKIQLTYMIIYIALYLNYMLIAYDTNMINIEYLAI